MRATIETPGREKEGVCSWEDGATSTIRGAPLVRGIENRRRVLVQFLVGRCRYIAESARAR